MYKITARSIVRSFFVLCMISGLISCTTSKRSNADRVERLQNSTEYSAVESEWNELYQ